VTNVANFCTASSRCVSIPKRTRSLQPHDVIHWRFIDDVLPYDIFIFFVSPFGVAPTSVHHRCVDIGRTVRVGFVQQRDYRQQDSPEKDRSISHSESYGIRRYSFASLLLLVTWHFALDSTSRRVIRRSEDRLQVDAGLICTDHRSAGKKKKRGPLEREREREIDLPFARFRPTSYQPLCLVLRDQVKFTRVIFRSLLNVSHVFARARSARRISVYANRANRYFESETCETATLEIFHIAIIRGGRSGKRSFVLRTPVKFTWFSFRQRQSTATSALPVPRSLSLRGHRGTRDSHTLKVISEV